MTGKDRRYGFSNPAPVNSRNRKSDMHRRKGKLHKTQQLHDWHGNCFYLKQPATHAVPDFQQRTRRFTSGCVEQGAYGNLPPPDFISPCFPSVALRHQGLKAGDFGRPVIGRGTTPPLPPGGVVRHSLHFLPCVLFLCSLLVFSVFWCSRFRVPPSVTPSPSFCTCNEAS